MAVAEADTTEINHPEWTEYRKKNGVDPLGMQNSSISFYQTPRPGISNVTLRIWYYGFHPWLCRTVQSNSMLPGAYFIVDFHKVKTRSQHVEQFLLVAGAGFDMRDLLTAIQEVCSTVIQLNWTTDLGILEMNANEIGTAPFDRG